MQRANIFDFDLTISVEHTFNSNKIENANDQNQYQLGKQHAKNNTKKGIDHVFKHDDHLNTSAIATYHNNPQYIAGYVAHILDRELILDNIIESSTTPKTSINKYKIQGMDKPFFISYIPDQHSAFQDKINNLQNKNKQLTALRHVLLNEKIIQETSVIHFYDDTEKNYIGARELDFIMSYSVTNSSYFDCNLEYKSNITTTPKYNYTQQKILPNEMLAYIQKEIIQEALDACECYKNQYKLIPNTHIDLADSLISILNDIHKQTENQEIYFCILVYMLKVMRQHLETLSSVKFLKKMNRLILTYNLDNNHLNTIIEEMFSRFDAKTLKKGLFGLHLDIIRATTINHLSSENTSQNIYAWLTGNKQEMRSHGIIKGEPLLIPIEHDQLHEIANYRETFITEHKNLYDNSFQFFRNSNINLNYTDELNVFIRHAKRNNNRSRQAFINMTWMDEEGNFTQAVPTIVKQSYYSQLSNNVSKTNSYQTMLII